MRGPAKGPIYLGCHVVLRSYDGKRIAVVLEIEGEERVVTGTAHYGQDPALGWVLRIALDGEEGSEFLIAESEWEGEITPGQQYGCDFCFRATE